MHKIKNTHQEHTKYDVIVLLARTQPEMIVVYWSISSLLYIKTKQKTIQLNRNFSPETFVDHSTTSWDGENTPLYPTLFNVHLKPALTRAASYYSHNASRHTSKLNIDAWWLTGQHVVLLTSRLRVQIPSTFTSLQTSARSFIWLC